MIRERVDGWGGLMDEVGWLGKDVETWMCERKDG